MSSFQVSHPISRYIFSLLVVTFIYFLCGLFGLQLAIQPGYATAIWPPAGIALAAVLLLGNRIFPSVLLGSFLVNTWVSYQATETITLTGELVAFIIGIGAASQACIGAALVRKYIGYPTPLVTDKSILLFLILGGPASCLINATVGVGILLASGITSLDYALGQWGTWWIGDTIGVLIFTPLIFIFAAEPRDIWNSRKRTVFPPLVICFLTVLATFYFSSGWEGHNQPVPQDKDAVTLASQSLTTWYVLAAGLLFTGFLGGFLLILTGRSSIIEIEVNRRTKELKDNGESLRLALDARSDGVWDWNIKTDEVIFSEKWIHSLGYKPNEIDKNINFWKQRLHPDDLEDTLNKLEAYFNDNAETYTHENRLSKHSGEYRYNLTLGHIVERDKNGNPLRMIGTDSDQTKARQVEEANKLHLQFLKNLDQIDLAIQHATDVEELMSNVLQVTQDILDTDRTWLLYPCDPGAKTWTVPMECTKPEYPSIKPGQEVQMLPEIAKVIRNALEINDVIIIDFDNPDAVKETAEKYTTKAEMQMALHPQTGNAWMFGVHQCSYARQWANEEKELFREIGHRLTDGLSSLIFLRDLKQSERRFRTLLEASPIAVYETDAQGACLYVNDNWRKLTGLTLEESLGDGWKKALHEEDRGNIFHLWQKNIHSQKPWNLEYRFCTPEGKVSWVIGKASALRNEFGQITGYLGANIDITERKRTDELLTFQASHDPLTGLNNRREFERRAERLLLTNQQDKIEHALCFMDLDQFKVVNDTGGHNAGDELLRQLGQVLQSTVRNRDTLARLGGDEFGVLMEHCSLAKAQRVASSLQEAIQHYQFIWEGQSFKVGVSIGLVAITETTTNLTELLKEADAACYMAKEKGRNRIQVYHEEDADVAERHGEMQWVTRIQQALEEDRFCLYAQAILPLNNRADIHYELLIRMLDKNNNIIPPGAFLPSAERYKLIEEIDYWVIKHAFTLLEKHPEFLEQTTFCSINLSGPSLANPQMLGFIIKQLDETSIECAKICFEITETAAISNLSIAMKFISTLKELGCQFALDDFGSGLSSFGYLKNLPVDYLKIDGMFVKDIVDDPIDYAMVKSINEIGQIMGMQTIAEFVENDTIKRMLKEIGVNYVQGYGIGIPVPIYQLLGQSSNALSFNYVKASQDSYS